MLLLASFLCRSRSCHLCVSSDIRVLLVKKYALQCFFPLILCMKILCCALTLNIFIRCLWMQERSFISFSKYLNINWVPLKALAFGWDTILLMYGLWALNPVRSVHETLSYLCCIRWWQLACAFDLFKEGPEDGSVHFWSYEREASWGEHFKECGVGRVAFLADSYTLSWSIRPGWWEVRMLQ